MRNFLRKQGKKKFNPVTATSMLFLNATDPTTINCVRKVMIEWIPAQGIGYQLPRRFLVFAKGTRPRDRLPR